MSPSTRRRGCGSSHPPRPVRTGPFLAKGDLCISRVPEYVTPRRSRSSFANATDAELKSYKDILDANPPQSKLEGFKKRSVRFITIGKKADRQALEFVYDTQSVRIRQVVFVHTGKGITFTCTAPQPHYGTADAEMFKPIFSRLEFR